MIMAEEKDGTRKEKQIKLCFPQSKDSKELSRLLMELSGEPGYKISSVPCDTTMLEINGAVVSWSQSKIKEFLETEFARVYNKIRTEFPHEYYCSRHIVKAPLVFSAKPPHAPQIFHLYNLVLNSLEPRANRSVRKDAREIGAYQHVYTLEGLFEVGVFKEGDSLGFTLAAILKDNQKTNLGKDLRVYASYARIPEESIKTQHQFRAFSRLPIDLEKDYPHIEEAWKLADKTKQIQE